MSILRIERIPDFNREDMSIIKGIITTLALAFFVMVLPAKATEPVYTDWLDNKAVRGFDTVLYHTQNKAIEGSNDFSTTWNGTSWYFTSQQNLDLFKAAPEKYAPQYGGYSAWGVAHDKLESSNPEVWVIEDAKLYLNHDKATGEKWKQDSKKLIPLADKKYPELLKQ